MDYDTILLDRPADGVAMITLNRPERGNGVVPEMAADLIHALNTLEIDTSVRVLVLTGAGKQFCAGADLVEFATYLADTQAQTQEPYNARVLWPVTQRLVSSRLPVIAAVNGGATAGGLDLALACDIRLGSDRAKVGETYIKLGLNPGNGGTYFLPRLVGSGLAAEMALTGDLYDAAQALAMGLFNRVVPADELVAEAVALAARIAERPRLAIEATKQQLRESWHMTLVGSMNASFWGVATLSYSDDLREGVGAALEKRAPVYNKKPS
ncbi:enoyl-CoA hydratase/isomerase family protein [Sphingomonas echinoides]|uniref:Enoyl-CoA hydratase-related protein n=1 Tax=Sphingomonas echinoides TaxID=59803 RepID=A0ABU4PPQ8_9SPHN|nr:enoyl-CoA hydratase-related protein [Sphingomonas echinoides]MDX5985118.1 enoyl-CoA hydratase-related protein [Sphingomonas echinoides]